jgi:hypothetical protein
MTSSGDDRQSSSSNPARSLPRPFWFGAALLLFLISSWTAFHQGLALNAYRHTNPLHADWWLTPVEFNAPRRLPQVWADFNDVFALKGTGQVWAVGSGGLILHSSDYGRHWTRQYLIDPNDPAADKPVDSTPASSSKGATAARLGPQPSWRRLAPGPLESAFLLGLLVKPAPTAQEQPHQFQQQVDPSQSPIQSKPQSVNPKSSSSDINNNNSPAPEHRPADKRNSGKRAVGKVRQINLGQTSQATPSQSTPPVPVRKPELTLGLATKQPSHIRI